MSNFFLIGLFIVFASCNMYHPIDIVNKGKQIIDANKDALDSLIVLSNKIAPDSCGMYQISTSSTTDYFNPVIFYYDKVTKDVKNGGSFHISNENMELINKLLPKNDISDFMFVSDLYVTFSHEHYRDYNNQYAEIIYCYNKNKFKKLFSQYSFYEKGQEKNILDKSNWVYFYDSNWAITTSSTYFKKTREECLDLIN